MMLDVSLESLDASLERSIPVAAAPATPADKPGSPPSDGAAPLSASTYAATGGASASFSLDDISRLVGADRAQLTAIAARMKLMPHFTPPRSPDFDNPLSDGAADGSVSVDSPLGPRSLESQLHDDVSGWADGGVTIVVAPCALTAAHGLPASDSDIEDA